MKMYNNGQRPTKMYGGGMASPRKPMMMGGLAQENRTRQNQMTPKTADAMGMMTDQKKYGMGYLTGGQVKLDKNKNNRIDSGDFAMLRKGK